MRAAAELVACGTRGLPPPGEIAELSLRAHVRRVNFLADVDAGRLNVRADAPIILVPIVRRVLAQLTLDAARRYTACEGGRVLFTIRTLGLEYTLRQVASGWRMSLAHNVPVSIRLATP